MRGVEMKLFNKIVEFITNILHRVLNAGNNGAEEIMKQKDKDIDISKDKYHSHHPNPKYFVKKEDPKYKVRKKTDKFKIRNT